MRLYMYLLSTQLFVCLHLLLKLIIATGSYYKLGQNRIDIMQATLTQPNSFPIAYSINPIHRYSINKQFHYISLYVHAVTHREICTNRPSLVALEEELDLILMSQSHLGLYGGGLDVESTLPVASKCTTVDHVMLAQW